MGNEWNNLVKENSPHEEEAINKKLTAEIEKEEYLEKLVLVEKDKLDSVNKIWNYEQRKLDKLLGWEKVEDVTHSTRHATGKEEFVVTSETTFERREKIEYTFTKYEKKRVDKRKIRDLQAFNKLDQEVTEFFSQAKEKMGKQVVPAMFDNKECIQFGVVDVNKVSLIFAELVFMFMGLISLGSLGGALLFGLILPVFFVSVGALAIFYHRKKYAAYKPLVDAYHDKIKEFEERVKQITYF